MLISTFNSRWGNIWNIVFMRKMIVKRKLPFIINFPKQSKRSAIIKYLERRFSSLKCENCIFFSKIFRIKAKKKIKGCFHINNNKKIKILKIPNIYNVMYYAFNLCYLTNLYKPPLNQKIIKIQTSPNGIWL